MFFNKLFTAQFWANPLAAMGLMLYFGGSDSSSINKNENTTNTSSTGFSEVSGSVANAGASGDGNKINVTATDHGTVAGAFNLASKSLDMNSDFANKTIQANSRAVDAVRESSSMFAQELRGYAQAQSSNNDQRMVTMGKYLLLAAVTYGGIKAWSSKRGKA